MTAEKQKELEIYFIQIANEFVSKHTNMESIFSIIPNDIDNVFKYYHFLKDEIKVLIDYKSEFRQDRHKIASVLIFSILSIKPIKVVKHNEFISEDSLCLMINQLFALIIAEYIIFSFIGIEKRNFIFPEKTTIDKPYEESLIGLITSMSDGYTHQEKELPKVKNYILSLSNILFLLEKYTLDLQRN